MRGWFVGGGEIEVSEGVGDLVEYKCEFGCKEGEKMIHVAQPTFLLPPTAYPTPPNLQISTMGTILNTYH